jgi:hypothetical protein
MLWIVDLFKFVGVSKKSHMLEHADLIKYNNIFEEIHIQWYTDSIKFDGILKISYVPLRLALPLDFGRHNACTPIFIYTSNIEFDNVIRVKIHIPVS